MALRNKDGTTYTLHTVKVSNQFWVGDENLIFHNFSWKGIPSIAVPVKPTPREREVVTIQADKQETLPNLPIPVSQPQPQPPQPQAINKNAIVLHCLPLIGQTKHRDDLYGDAYSKPQYGEKSLIEAIVLERGDLMLVLWISKTLKTKDDTIVNSIDYLKQGTIIFPSKYKDGEKFRDYRWWKISEVESQQNGVIIKAVVTDIQPSFD